MENLRRMRDKYMEEIVKKDVITDGSYLAKSIKRLNLGCGKKYIPGFVHVELADL